MTGMKMRYARGAAVNPECRDGKHKNCDGTGLDPETDEFIDCGCVCHDFD